MKWLFIVLETHFQFKTEREANAGLCSCNEQNRIHVFSVKQNSRTENFQTEHCRKENSGTRKFQESQFVMEFENFVLEKIPGFYFKQGRKFQDF